MNQLKENKVRYLLIAIIALIGWLTFLHFHHQTSTVRENAPLIVDSLEQTRDSSLISKKQKSEEELAIEAIRNASTMDHDFFIENLFSLQSNDIRKAAQTMILRKFKNDSDLISNLLNYALDGRMNDTYKSSLWRTSYILTQLPDHLVAAQESLVQDFFRAMFAAELVGKNTQMDMDSIVEKIIREE